MAKNAFICDLFRIFEDEMQEIIKTYTYAYSGEEI